MGQSELPRSCALRTTDNCIFRSVKSSPQEDEKKDEKYWNRYQQEKMMAYGSSVALSSPAPNCCASSHVCAQHEWACWRVLTAVTCMFLFCSTRLAVFRLTPRRARRSPTRSIPLLASHAMVLPRLETHKYLTDGH